MRYTIYKLSFPNGIHIGTGNLSSTEKVCALRRLIWAEKKNLIGLCKWLRIIN